jgi:hypothetical protein
MVAFARYRKLVQLEPSHEWSAVTVCIFSCLFSTQLRKTLASGLPQTYQLRTCMLRRDPYLTATVPFVVTVTVRLQSMCLQCIITVYAFIALYSIIGSN